ncbi:GNAT family N-acetyltransferase [Propionibacteriaceae bacterium G1746]|uniref:GNAT family N-acetyltransferase n=1 Tax=Aestuariimicrobium sp. G57 TaxID=3418485 RepID=UPI003C199FD1
MNHPHGFVAPMSHTSIPVITTRPVTPAEFDDWAKVVGNAQGRDHDERSLRWLRQSLPLERTRGAFDGADPVGGIAALPRQLTLPGGQREDVAGIACAAVSPTHRRRGVFSQLVRDLFTDMYEHRREALAVLNSDQAEVYTRFGFGMAMQTAVVHGQTRFMGYRPDVELGTGRVTLVDEQVAAGVLPRVHARARQMNVGWAERSPTQWSTFLTDLAATRSGRTTTRFAIHWDAEGQPQGYATYWFAERLDERGRTVNRLLVPELVAVHRSAYAQLWRFLLDLDAADSVRANCAPDEALQYMVQDPEALDWTIRDALAVRLVDVPRALSSRRYSAPVDVTFEVTDHLCPWNHGTFRLQADEAGAMCVRSRDEPQLSMSVQALGAAFLGGTPLMSLALAGRVLAKVPTTLAQASVAFRGFREPSCPSTTGWPWY